jgi:hypothetical protein
MKSVQALILEEEGKIPDAAEYSRLVPRYELQFLSNDDSQTVHKVEVRRVNFQDIMRHLGQGNSVLITPKLQENSTKKQRQDRTPWYFTHM